MTVARATVAGLVALCALEVLWESLLAPVRPGGGWLALKALPLAALLPRVMRGARKPRQWLALLLPWYAAEGSARRHRDVRVRTGVVAPAVGLGPIPSPT